MDELHLLIKFENLLQQKQGKLTKRQAKEP